MPPATPLKPGLFWAVGSFDHRQVVEPNGRWWIENTRRANDGSVILQYALEGRMVFRDGSGSRDVPAGWMAMFAFGEESAYGLPASYGEPFVTEWMQLRGAGLREHIDELRRRFGSVVYIGHNNPLRRMRRRLCDAARPRSVPAWAAAANDVHAFVMRLYMHLEARHAKERPPVARAIDELLRQPEQSWSIKEVAARQGCSREHLARVFRERHGVSPAAYLVRARLAKALELLRETTLPLPLVVEQSGFANKHTLARWVKAQTGLPPGAYRERAQNPGQPPAP
ncbi:MAG: AraC family transcriptional regulator [Planctomycetes bacterium]|nr:AraC family transcriptional regulator [Planctomycetota bacterium]